MPATTEQIAGAKPACYGVGCPQRGQCERYTAVERTTEPYTEGTCDVGNGVRPLFVARVAVAEEA
jgi:hypothetical protein